MLPRREPATPEAVPGHRHRSKTRHDTGTIDGRYTRRPEDLLVRFPPLLIQLLEEPHDGAEQPDEKQEEPQDICSMSHVGTSLVSM